MDHGAAGAEGHHAVGHMEEQGGELVALVFHLGDGVLQHLGHVVEIPGQGADLVPAGDLQLLGEISRRHLPGACGQGADGRDQNLGQQKGQNHADGQAQHQRPQNNPEQLAGQVVDRGFVVQDVDDVAAAAALDGHGQIHGIRGDGAAHAHLAVHSRQQVGGHGHGGRLVGAVQNLSVAVQHIDVPLGQVDAQIRLGHEQLLELLRRAGRHCGHLLQLNDEVLGEGLGHLVIELVDVVAADAVDEEGTHHRHQGENQQNHNHNHLGTK